MSRSRPSSISKPRRKKSKRVSKTSRSNNLESKVQKSGVLNWILFELENGVALLEPQSMFNQALIGVSYDGKAVYAEEKIIKAFMKDGMTSDEAVEFYEYNTLRALPYVPQEARPIIIRTS